MTDNHLLDRYISEGSQTAFTELAKRHMGMVYATCRRDIGDRQLAEDATQMVFVLLAQKASTIRRNASIGGWLFMAARNISRDLLRRERTRKRYEGEAAMKSDSQTLRDTAWDEIESSLNDALTRLRSTDRDIVLKRYFEGLSVRELADEIGTTEDTAAKRLSRAVDRLRRSFKGQEVTVTSVALAALLLKHAASPVPHHLAAAVSLAPQSTIEGVGIAVRKHSLNSLLAKGICAMSTAKVVSGIAALVLVALLVAFIAVDHNHTSHQTASSAVQWAVPPSSDSAIQAEEQQVQARYSQYMEAWNSYSAPKILAELSPDFTMINPGGGKPTTFQDFARFLPNALATTTPGRSTTAKITSCQISGNTAVLAVKEFHHSSSNDKPFDGDSDTITVTMVDTGGEWLISRIGP